MTGWRTMDDGAPKDGTEILVYRQDMGMLFARWIAPCEFLTESEGEHFDEDDWHTPAWFAADFVNGSRLECNEQPTHWMPLPEPPEPST